MRAGNQDTLHASSFLSSWHLVVGCLIQGKKIALSVTIQLLFVFFLGACGETVMSLVVQKQKQQTGSAPQAASLPDWVMVSFLLSSVSFPSCTSYQDAMLERYRREL